MVVLLRQLLSLSAVLGSRRVPMIATSGVATVASPASSCATRGIIFDLDGTLTLPGAIDFNAMYRRIGLDRRPGTDLLTQVNAMADLQARSRAHGIIVEEERIGVGRMQLRSDLLEFMGRLHSSSVKNLAISTRNCPFALEAFLGAIYDQSPLRFYPTLHRDTLGLINKPDPRVAMHIIEQWRTESAPNNDMRSEEVWFVGDSEDDVACGKSAGMKTCLLLTDYNCHLAAEQPGLVDLQVATLMEFADHIRL